MKFLIEIFNAAINILNEGCRKKYIGRGLPITNVEPKIRPSNGTGVEASKEKP